MLSIDDTAVAIHNTSNAKTKTLTNKLIEGKKVKSKSFNWLSPKEKYRQ
jgi:hypothetical protein